MKQIRESIREIVFNRDGNKCVVPWCNNAPDDAHHLIDRKLWDDSENGGYIKDNLISICESHHKLAENNTIMPQTLREWSGIKNIVLPKEFDKQKEYDKWGKELLLANRENIKYPHTPYFPFSPNVDEKDIAESGYMNLGNLLNKPLYFSIKMDGSNVVLTNEYVAARNGRDATHASYDMLKSIHAQIKTQIHPDLMIFGEWLYAKHSIYYTNSLKLHKLLQIFGIYNKKTHMWLSIMDMYNIIATLMKKNPTLSIGGVSSPNRYQFIYILSNNIVFKSEKALKSEIIKFGNIAISEGHEGIVIRNIYPFHHGKWNENIAKYVRNNHVQTDDHWSLQPIIRNDCV
jgi:hypothetical protein